MKGNEEWAVKALKRIKEQNKAIIDTEATREAAEGIVNKGKGDRRETNRKKKLKKTFHNYGDSETEIDTQKTMESYPSCIRRK